MPKSAAERNIKLVMEYDGSAYFGFQRQPRHRTIQAELEKALSQLFNRKLKIEAASGRTDSGTSAVGQVVNFKIKSDLPVEKIKNALNGILPEDIVITSLKNARADFHARYSAKGKTYEYTVLNRRERAPLKRTHAYHVNQALDVGLMKIAAKHFVGKHNFKSFCAADPAKPDREDTVRRISALKIIKKGDEIRFRVEADGFLYKMVRNIVGTLIEVGLGKRSPESIPALLKICDRTKAGKTAPAHGLVLVKVSY